MQQDFGLGLPYALLRLGSKGEVLRGEREMWTEDFLEIPGGFKRDFLAFLGILWEILVDCSGLKRKNEPFLKKFGFSSGHLEGEIE